MDPRLRSAAALFTFAVVSLSTPALAGIEQAPAHPDRLLVRFAAGTSEAERSSVLALAGLRTRRHLRRAGLHVVESPARGRSRAALVARLRAARGVASVEPDYELRAASLVPDDPGFGALWGMTAIRAPEAWDRTTGSRSLVVGLVDTGVDYTHPDLAPNIWRNPGESPNGTDDDANGYVDDIHGIDCVNGDGDPFDDNGHGTSVAGVLGAAGNNGIGVVGVSWNARIMALKILPASGPGYVSDAIECLDYASAMRARGVDIRITNNSWGGGGYSASLRAAFERASQAGLLTVIAAGNGGRDLDAIPSYPTCYEVDGLLTVGALDGAALLDFSNFGALSVDIAAPGVDIRSATPGGGYASFWGTSVAAPHVSGAAVLVWTLHPEATARMVKTLLLGTAQPLPGLHRKVVSGGLLDVAAAVTRPLILDSDGDGIADTADNCPWYATQNTADADRDGIGDVCSCGDENLDRIVDVRDLVALNEVIFNRRAAGPLCDVNGDDVCDVSDSARIYQRIYGAPAYCSRYPKPRP